jgi:hypothetical protein
LQKLFRLYARLPENGAKRTFRHVARVVGNGGVAVACRVEPDFVAAGGLAVEGKAECLQAFDDLALTETGELAHQSATMSG